MQQRGITPRLITAAAITLTLVCGCGGDNAPQHTFVAVTFNTGTTEGLDHDALPDDGYDAEDAAVSDMYYGDGLAWLPAVEATRVYLAEVSPDVIVFQEIFHPGECAAIPATEHAGFYCETWSEGDATVAQHILGAGYQVACNLGKPDKCAAVKKSFGSFRGCTGDVCLDGLAGSSVSDCGSGSRVGRGVIDLAVGGSITVVNIHGSSGLTSDDKNCRAKQFEQAFVDLGDGAPGANGAANVVMGDLNTDPARLATADISAQRFNDFVGDGKPFHFVTEVGEGVTPTYGGIVNIDHVVSDRYDGECYTAGISDGRRDVTDAVYFDHKPVVCTLSGNLPE